MADPRTLDADPTAIGGVVTPPFARLPDPAALFLKRGLRLRAYADHSDLKPFLLFLAGLADVQAAVAAGLAPVAPPSAETLARARDTAMPPLDRAALLPDAAFDAAFDALFDAAAGIAQPEEARAALARIAGDRALRDACARTVLAGETPEAGLAEHAYAAAAVQVHMARLAATLDEAALVPVGTGACPACGGPPVSSIIVGWAERRRGALLHLRALRHDVERGPGEMHPVRLHQGHHLHGRRGRHRHREGRDLRRVPPLREDPAGPEGHAGRCRRGRCRQPRGSTC